MKVNSPVVPINVRKKAYLVTYGCWFLVFKLSYFLRESILYDMMWMTMSLRVVNICYWLNSLQRDYNIHPRCLQTTSKSNLGQQQTKYNKRKQKKSLSINKICEFPFSKFLFASFIVEDWKLKCSIAKSLIARQTFSRLSTIGRNFSKSVKRTGMEI